MKRSQRNAHLATWIALAIFVPLGLIAALRARHAPGTPPPRTATSPTAQHPTP